MVAQGLHNPAELVLFSRKIIKSVFDSVQYSIVCTSLNMYRREGKYSRVSNVVKKNKKMAASSSRSSTPFCGFTVNGYDSSTASSRSSTSISSGAENSGDGPGEY